METGLVKVLLNVFKEVRPTEEMVRILFSVLHNSNYKDNSKIFTRYIDSFEYLIRKSLPPNFTEFEITESQETLHEETYDYEIKVEYDDPMITDEQIENILDVFDISHKMQFHYTPNAMAFYRDLGKLNFSRYRREGINNYLDGKFFPYNDSEGEIILYCRIGLAVTKVSYSGFIYKVLPDYDPNKYSRNYSAISFDSRMQEFINSCDDIPATVLDILNSDSDNKMAELHKLTSDNSNPEEIDYTIRHREAYAQYEKILGLTGYASIFHDLDKFVYYMFGTSLTEKEISLKHRSTASHHGDWEDIVGAMVDMECAHLTKPAMQKRAYETVVYLYPDRLERAVPVLKELGIMTDENKASKTPDTTNTEVKATNFI